MAPLKVHGPVRMRSMQTGITKWKEGSFEIVEKDNKVSLVVHYNVGGIPKTFQVGAAGPGPSRLSGVAAPSSSFLSAVPRCGPALNYSGVALRHRLDERGRAAGAELRLTCCFIGMRSLSVTVRVRPGGAVMLRAVLPLLLTKTCVV